MPDTFTTNLNLTKPEVGASSDTWGTKLNANNDAIDALFPSGDLAVANGGTGASDAATARANLGLGTMAQQSADNVTITNGSALLNILAIASTAPNMVLVETDAGADSGRWRFVVEGQAFYAQVMNDAGTQAGSFIAVNRNGWSPTTVNVQATLQVSGNTVYHAGNISSAAIAETQIPDGSVLARVGGNETVTGTWNFSVSPNKTSAGKFIHFASDTHNGGAVTVSTSDPSGTPAAGDIWLKYTA